MGPNNSIGVVAEPYHIVPATTSIPEVEYLIQELFLIQSACILAILEKENLCSYVMIRFSILQILDCDPKDKD